MIYLTLCCNHQKDSGTEIPGGGGVRREGRLYIYLTLHYHHQKDSRTEIPGVRGRGGGGGGAGAKRGRRGRLYIYLTLYYHHQKDSRTEIPGSGRKRETMYINLTLHGCHHRAHELRESRGGRPGLSFLTSLMVSVDVKQY